MIWNDGIISRWIPFGFTVLSKSVINSIILMGILNYQSFTPTTIFFYLLWVCFLLNFVWKFTVWSFRGFIILGKSWLSVLIRGVRLVLQSICLYRNLEGRLCVCGLCLRSRTSFQYNYIKVHLIRHLTRFVKVKELLVDCSWSRTPLLKSTVHSTTEPS